MTTPNQLTDTRALSLHRARAKSNGLFLQESAADEIQDRLGMVNRAFKSPAVVTPFADLWARRLPSAKVVEDSDTLALEPGAHDLVIHAMSLHWANDPVGQLIQCRRSLKPDGLLIAATLGGQTLEELRACIGQAEIAITGGLSPRVAPMGEIRDLGALLQRAGFALPVADSLPIRTEYRDAMHLMHDLRQMGETNALSQRRKTTPPRALFTLTSQQYAEAFSTPTGRVKATYEMVFLTGWAPDASQQQPLRPGSAKQRLADALKVPEVPLGD
ncbi:methyltransferase domain-containing protein [Roseobacter weihaiensis]|uniref:methyltransferase domain-containing protein n=1 Tax=Roseobacter weihaiensis TaxID=2763262 RepID=UPI001D0B4F56|nr:methyltransferase domain-containing protein [Roseobacter sp. H9]